MIGSEHREVEAILNAVDEMGYDTEWLRAENTAISVTDGEMTLEPAVMWSQIGCCSPATNTPRTGSPRDDISRIAPT